MIIVNLELLNLYTQLARDVAQLAICVAMMYLGVKWLRKHA